MILPLLILALLPAAGRAAPIYGDDDRLDLFEVSEPAVREQARSVVAIFQASDVWFKDGRARLPSTAFGQTEKLARWERFYGQPDGAVCSGALVGEDLVLTANHCVSETHLLGILLRGKEDLCDELKFVFDYALTSEDRDPTLVPASSVYGCARIEARGALLELQGLFEQTVWRHDWALVRLDRKVADREPLKVGTGRLRKGDRLYAIGHPKGLPAKATAGGTVREPDAELASFSADLDIFHGSSGSPVFSSRTGLIEGVAVRCKDGPDFVEASSGTYKSKRLPQNGGGGMQSTKASEFIRQLEALLRADEKSGGRWY